MKPLCLTAPPSGSLCLNGSWSAPSDDWQLHGTFSSLPLGSVQNMLPTPWPIKGPLNGTIELAGKKIRILAGKLHGDSSGMTMSVPLENNGEHILQWQKNILQATYADNKLQIKLDSELTDKSRLSMDVSLADLQLPGSDLMDSPLNGTVQLHVEDLSPLALLTEQRVRVSGALQGQFALKGTPAAPMISGQVELAKGQAEIPPLGITLSPLTVAIKGDNNRLQLQATAHSGSGVLHAESTLHVGQSDSSTNTVLLTGEAFKAAQLPGLDLDLSPDLQVVVGKSQIDIRGTVTIPKARIKSIDFDDAIVPSNDMIVIDDEQGISSPTAGLPLYTSVTVIAGDDVQIDAYGLRGILSGKLQVSGQPDRVPVGNGTLTVQKGTFTMYGKRLKIDLGRLLFTGGPLTNPGIELRSESRSDKVTTGVIVEGFLQHPEISFYSTPPMEQSAIVLNLLENTAIGGETRGDTGFIGKVATKVGLGGMVPYLQSLKKVSMIDEIKFDTGDDFDSMSLVFGSWLTPYFYVSYGKNLIEESGTFNTRYTLGQGFYFMTETGPSQSGGDLKYEFEH
jgi:translocation and assembly module TamB